MVQVYLKNAKKVDPDQRVRIVRSHDETPKEIWSRCVAEGKLLIMKRDKSRIRICELAQEVCDIKWGGGGHWSGFENQNTVTKFAVEIGVKPKTLLEWMSVKAKVYDKLNKKHKDDASWSSMARTRRELKGATSKTKVTKLYEKQKEEQNKKGNVFNLKRYIKHVRYNIKNISKIPQDDLAEVKSALEEMLAEVDTRLKGKGKLK